MVAAVPCQVFGKGPEPESNPEKTCLMVRSKTGKFPHGKAACHPRPHGTSVLPPVQCTQHSRILSIPRATMNSQPSALSIAILTAALITTAMGADPWTCDFRKPLYLGFWTVSSVGSTDFTTTTTSAGLLVTGPQGGSGFQSSRILLNLDRYPDGLTDFDASVSFALAEFTPGHLHQVQIECAFENQYIAVVKDINDYHVYRDPPASEAANTASTATAGTMRLVRSGSTLAAYLNDSTTPFWSQVHSANPLTYFAIALNKNSTAVATSVTWTDFSITPAPTPDPVITSCSLTPAGFYLNWQGTGQLPVTVERSNALSSADWLTVSSGNTNRFFTNSSPPAERAFYRIRAPVN